MSNKKLDPTDISGMVDELDQSGFFRQPVPQERTGYEPEIRNVEKAPKHQSTKAPDRQAIKLLKHISSYLTPESWKRIKMVATERDQHDYEVLQKAVDLFLEQLDTKET
jgi:hypothetical protein